MKYGIILFSWDSSKTIENSWLNNLKSVFDCLNQENINGLVIQKYIENPLLIYGKKLSHMQLNMD